MFYIKHVARIFVYSTILVLSASAYADKSELHIYNWSDFIAPNTISDFETQYNVKVTYDVFDSNEVLDGKLMSGNTGFDIVVPSDSFLARQLHADIYQPLDRTKLPNYHHLDAKMLKTMQIHDPDNKYAIPYLWQSTGIAYNVNKVKEILGDDAPLDSWDLVFNAENLKKLSRCGVSFLDAPSEVFPTVLNYLGKDPNSQNTADYEVATQFLENLRPYVTYFHNSKYINDLSGGDICVAIAWSGDVMQATVAADEADDGVKIAYIVPKEGAILSFDVFAIPKNAKNIDQAYQFLNYILEPKVIANITNSTLFPNPNKDDMPFVDKDVKNNPNVYPPQKILDRLFPIKEQPPKMDRVMARLWTRVLTGI
ncbi:extracellular solute-binding protein [Orbaceae bacterium ac157xtp]